jgi:hypothetical protein
MGRLLFYYLVASFQEPDLSQQMQQNDILVILEGNLIEEGTQIVVNRTVGAPVKLAFQVEKGECFTSGSRHLRFLVHGVHPGGGGRRRVRFHLGYAIAVSYHGNDPIEELVFRDFLLGQTFQKTEGMVQD